MISMFVFDHYLMSLHLSYLLTHFFPPKRNDENLKTPKTHKTSPSSQELSDHHQEEGDQWVEEEIDSNPTEEVINSSPPEEIDLGKEEMGNHPVEEIAHSGGQWAEEEWVEGETEHREEIAHLEGEEWVEGETEPQEEIAHLEGGEWVEEETEHLEETEHSQGLPVEEIDNKIKTKATFL